MHRESKVPRGVEPARRGNYAKLARSLSHSDWISGIEESTSRVFSWTVSLGTRDQMPGVCIYGAWESKVMLMEGQLVEFLSFPHILLPLAMYRVFGLPETNYFLTGIPCSTPAMSRGLQSPSLKQCVRKQTKNEALGPGEYHVINVTKLQGFWY